MTYSILECKFENVSKQEAILMLKTELNTKPVTEDDVACAISNLKKEVKIQRRIRKRFEDICKSEKISKCNALDLDFGEHTSLRSVEVKIKTIYAIIRELQNYKSTHFVGAIKA